MNNRSWVNWLPRLIQVKLNDRFVLQAIIANSGWLIFDKVIRAILGLLVVTWLARYLGPTQYGELAYVLAYIAIFQVITTLGLDTIVVREISQYENQTASILGTCLMLRLATGVTCWVAAILIMASMDGWSNNVWLIAIAGGSLVFQAADTVDLWFQSQSRSRFTVAVKLGTYLISSGIKIILILANAPLMAFAMTILFESLLIAIGLAFSYSKFPYQESWKAARQISAKLIREAWPLLLSSLCVILYMRVDQILIRDLLGEKELGLYAAMLPLSTVWHIIPLSITSSLAPYMARAKQLGEEIFLKTLLTVFRIFLILSIGIATITIILADPLIYMMYGNAFETSADLLKIHILSIIPVFLGVAQTLWIINEKKYHIPLIKTAAGMVCSIALNLILIPKLGLIGATIAAVTSYFISAVLCNLILARGIFLMQLGINNRYINDKINS